MIDFSSFEEWTGYRLGRARTIKLLIEITNKSRNRDLQIKACLWLNEAHRGCGGEGCLNAILNDSSCCLNKDRERLFSELGKVPESNAKLRQALMAEGVGGVTDWARSKDPAEVRHFLDLLLAHPDRQIAALAADKIRKGGF